MQKQKKQAHSKSKQQEKREIPLTKNMKKTRDIARYNARCTKVVRVAIMMTDLGPYQEELLLGYKFRLQKIIPADIKISFEEFVSNGPYNELIIDNFKSVVRRKFDLIYAIGVRHSTLIQEMRKKMGVKIPMMFAGVSHPIKKGLIERYSRSQSGIFGVSVTSPSNILPVQLILVGRPDIETFFMPYRQDNNSYSMLALDFDEICDYFELHERKIVCHPYKGMPTQEIFDEMKKYKAVILPEGGMSYAERNMFLQAATSLREQNYDIVMFSDGKDAVKKGAVFGLKSDVRLVGKINAEQTKELFVDGISPCRMESRSCNNPRSIVFSMKRGLESRFGAIFTQDILLLLNDVMHTNEPIPDFFKLIEIFTSYKETDSPILEDLLSSISKKVKTRLKVVTGKKFPVNLEGVPEKTTFYRDMEAFISKEVGSDHVKGLYVGGGRAVKLAAEKIALSGKPLRLESVQIAHSLQQAQGLDIKLPFGASHTARVIQPIDPSAIILALRACVERCSKAYIIVGLPKDSYPAGTKEYLDLVVAQGKKQRVTVKVFASTSAEEIKEFLDAKSRGHKGEQTKRSAFFSAPHLIENELLETIADYCKEKSIMFAVPSLSYKGRAPIAFGVDEKATRSLLARHMEQGVAFMESCRVYSFHISSRLVYAWGGRVSHRLIKELHHVYHIDDEQASYPLLEYGLTSYEEE